MNCKCNNQFSYVWSFQSDGKSMLDIWNSFIKNLE